MNAVRLAALLVLVGACAQPAETSQPPCSQPPCSQAQGTLAPAAAVDATDLLETFECHRCHDGLSLEPLPRDRHCVQCHRDIHDGRFDASPEALHRWRRNIVSLRHVPSLQSVGSRLRRDWVRAHLLEPVDTRPALAATMPRLAITSEEAERIASHLVPAEAPTRSPSAADSVIGASLYRQLGCASCHQFAGVDSTTPPAEYRTARHVARPTSEAIALAPDLSHARERFQSGRLEAWIADPRALAADTLMPSFELSALQARQLAAFILLAPLDPRPAVAIPERLPILSRKVGYDEVAQRVLRVTCWHCHSEPDLARGDGGPGNSGGFGFAPRGLDLSSYAGIASGSIGPDGARRSVFSRDESTTPRIVAHLLARQSEEAGAPIDGHRGMPLGLPALAPEQIQLVETWIAQGRPR